MFTRQCVMSERLIKDVFIFITKKAEERMAWHRRLGGLIYRRIVFKVVH